MSVLILFCAGHFRLPKAVAGTLKVSKKTKAKAVSILSKLSDETPPVIGQASAPSIVPKETIAKKRTHEQSEHNSHIYY